MKRTYFLLMLFALLVAPKQTAWSYQKYRYLNYDYQLTSHPESELHLKVTKGKTPFKPEAADYLFVSDGGVLSSCVSLSHADRRRLRKELKAYTATTPITDELIAKHKGNSKSTKTQIVGWVLSDFKAAYTNATVGQIFSVLGLDNSETPHEQATTVNNENNRGTHQG